MTSPFPMRIDRMPLDFRKRLDPDEVIAFALSSVPYRWSGRAVSVTSEPVRAVMDAIRLSGYAIVVATAENKTEKDHERVDR